jgi:hypothetical protein
MDQLSAAVGKSDASIMHLTVDFADRDGFCRGIADGLTALKELCEG